MGGALAVEIADLIQEVNAINKKYEFLDQKTGRAFNIFSVLGVSSDEVKTCRVIYELLSPSGSHGQGTLFLKLFFKTVLDIEVTDQELAIAKVHREYVIDDSRRIDLVISTNDMFIPIEVKIYAEEQRHQCDDYLTEARKHVSNPYLYYLTRFGTEPSSNSASDLSYIRTISFKDHIIDWLTQCACQEQCLALTPIKEVIAQFITAIKRFTGQEGENAYMETRDIISRSADNMRSAATVQKAFEAAKTDLIYRYFKAVEDGVKARTDIRKLDNEYDYAANNMRKVNTFYNMQKSSCPGISYEFADIPGKGKLWVRVEIDYRLFVGYVSVIDGKWHKQPNYTVEEANKLLDIGTNKIDTWWLYSEYLPQKIDSNSEPDEVSPNFKGMNELWYKMFDADFFNNVVNKTVDRIIELLNKKLDI